jgi:hypothetical protein
MVMVDRPTSLDEHRGMAAQVATELRRTKAEVEADQAALRQRREELKICSQPLRPQIGSTQSRRRGIFSPSLPRRLLQPIPAERSS